MAPKNVSIGDHYLVPSELNFPKGERRTWKCSGGAASPVQDLGPISDPGTPTPQDVTLYF